MPRAATQPVQCCQVLKYQSTVPKYILKYFLLFLSVLFLIYINDLDCNINNWILKFADDTKIFSKITDDKDRDRLQQDLLKFTTWSEEWQMMFNTTKCKVMHIGKKRVHSQYFMNNHQLDEVKEEKDLGILISHDLKVSQQCQLAYNEASRILGLINRTIEYKHPNILIPSDSPLQITRQATPGILCCCLVPTLHQRQGVNRKNL